jgi:hypothetical protein
LLCHVALRIRNRPSQPKEYVATKVGPAFAREGLRPDPGLSLVRGTPSWHQDSSMALIDELRRGR